MIIFAHGLEGSPNGSKIRSLRDAGFEVVAPDFQGMNLAERVDLLEEVCLEYASQQPVLAGSHCYYDCYSYLVQLLLLLLLLLLDRRASCRERV